jgi:hypothetical protein
LLALQGVPDDAIVRCLVSWTQLFGAVSLELFGHLVRVVEDAEALFSQAVADMGAFVGLDLSGEPPIRPTRPSRLPR